MKIRFRVTAVLALLSLGLGACAQETPVEFLTAPEGIVRDPMLVKTPSAMNDPSGRLQCLIAAHVHARRSASRMNFTLGSPFLLRCDAGPVTDPSSAGAMKVADLRETRSADR